LDYVSYYLNESKRSWKGGIILGECCLTLVATSHSVVDILVYDCLTPDI